MCVCAFASCLTVWFLFIGILHDCVLFDMATASLVNRGAFGVELLGIIMHNDMAGLQRLLGRASVDLYTCSELDVRPLLCVGDAPVSILVAIGLCGTTEMLACALATQPELDETRDMMFVANLVNCDCWE